MAALLYLQPANNQTEEMLEVNNSLTIVKYLYGFQKQLSCHSFQEAKEIINPFPLQSRRQILSSTILDLTLQEKANIFF
jgi:hypothetical protein